MLPATIARVKYLSTNMVRAIVATLVLAFAAPGHAWWGDGHGILSQAAVLAQPQEVPAFFRGGAASVAHASFDPDIFKNRAAPNLYDGEHHEHYIDLELLAGAELPPLRHDFISLCQSLDQSPAKVGYAPYAITEHAQRLMLAFAEHRKWPDNTVIQAKVLIYAGILAHYAQDVAQPLHTTIHFDGRTADDGTKQHVGIHETMDSAVERLQMDPAKLARSVSVAPFEGDLFDAVHGQILQSHSHVDHLYELADGLGDDMSDEGRQFAQERARHAVTFTANLFLTAWVASEDVRLPGWLER